MTLPPPFPKENVNFGRKFAPVILQKRYLSTTFKRPDVDIFSVLTTRRSTRILSPICEDRLSELLWHAARVLEMAPPSKDYPLRKTPAPSAGGLSSINLLLQSGSTSIQFYDPVAHALGRTHDEGELVSLLHAQAMLAIAAPSATILWLAGDQMLIDTFYVNGESLLWRDSGAIAAVITVVAEALGLGACILGISGEPHISRLFGGSLIGFGAVIVGEKY